MRTVETKVPLNVQLLRYAYTEHKHASIRFPLEKTTICNQCGSEYMFIAHEDVNGKVQICQHCGHRVSDPRQAA